MGEVAGEQEVEGKSLGHKGGKGFSQMILERTLDLPYVHSILV